MQKSQFVTIKILLQRIIFNQLLKLASMLDNRVEQRESKSVMDLFSRMLACIHTKGIRWIYFLKEELEWS